MTKFYQQLDLRVNDYCKRYLKSKFNECYSCQVKSQLDNGVETDDIQVGLQLTKPVHASWIVEFYNNMSTPKEKEIIDIGWKLSPGNVFYQKGVLENFAKLTRRYMCRRLFFNKVQLSIPACNFIKKENLAQVCACELFQNTFFIEHLQMTACKQFFSSI